MNSSSYYSCSEVFKDKLKRHYAVSISPAVLKTEYDSLLAKEVSKAKLNGFRNKKREGKVQDGLTKIFEKKMGNRLMSMVVRALVKRSKDDALVTTGLNYIFGIEKDVKFSKQEGVSYVIEAELMPDNLPGIEPEDISLNTYECEISDKDIDAEIEFIAQNNPVYESLKDKSIGISAGHKVVIDFEAKIDGEPFKDSSGHGIEIDVNLSDEFIKKFQIPKEFISQILGMHVGESKNFDFLFPADYSRSDIAGKKASCFLSLRSAKTPRMASIDEIIRLMDVKDESVLRDKIKDSLKVRANNIARGIKINQILTAIDKRIEIKEFPESIINAERAEIMVTLDIPVSVDEAEFDLKYASLLHRKVKGCLFFINYALLSSLSATDEEKLDYVMHQVRMARNAKLGEQLLYLYVHDEDSGLREWAKRKVLEGKGMLLFLSKVHLSEPKKVSLEELRKISVDADLKEKMKIKEKAKNIQVDSSKQLKKDTTKSKPKVEKDATKVGATKSTTKSKPKVEKDATKIVTKTKKVTNKA